ncbi:MAG TPA: ATP-dependent RNA helicase HrpA [Streptosporangiaceae bacterium]|nr:ATP-dependent RNA helicase HrpA [Streptosporangiaceae bacterium]
MENAAVTSSPADLRGLRERLPGLMGRDRERLGRRADAITRLRSTAARERALRAIRAELEEAAARAEARRLAVPRVSYPAELPISQKKDEIATAIRDNQVVIVAGETGSGKTTQLPKICLDLGRGVAGQIGHTQPRRIAARTIAERISAELGTGLGTAVGYKVRFTDASSDNTLVKVMTDGILLTEMQHDRRLLRYDTLIIDEAHERSLNIDFILGYLKKLLPSRPDLKVIITSATIDPERFSAHFWDAPVIEVSGRTYPVEVRYRPLGNPGDPGAEPRDQAQGICDAVDELCAEGPGDILVFLSGEREIRDTADALKGRDGLEVLPLYARLSAAEQHRVFQPHGGRRVVLATNVAETSLTVPGIRYVVDPGTARISRYSHRTKVQRLPIEPVSQASANQRKGRCGRTSDGVCIRLYSSGDFAARPEFTDPEILRTNLASVILRMAALGLGEVADFPFIDPPDSRNVADGIRLLTELGALAGERPGGNHAKTPARQTEAAARGTEAAARGTERARAVPASGEPARRGLKLTETGRTLARLPVDPRIGRMIIEAGRNGCAAEVLVIAAALSIQDPRERPAESREAADAMHARFAEPGSDFLTLLNLWDYVREQQRELSSSAFRRMCRREYLHYLRVREWQDLHGQLRQVARDLGIGAGGASRGVRAAQARHGSRAAAGREAPGAGTSGAEAPARGADARGTETGGADARGTDAGGRVPAELAQRIHVSLLAGLLSHIGMRQERETARGARRGPAEFAGARGARFAIFPDSALARKPPRWVVAAELAETSRLWARTVARIEPEWAEPLAGHLVRRSYSEPHWDARRGAVMALEKVTLYGLPIVTARPVNYARIDPALSRELFIRHALVEGDWTTHHRFFHENRRLLEEAGELERRARRHGIVADDEALVRFYDERIPAEVVSARHFDAWWKKARVADPGLLTLSPADLAGPQTGQVSPGDYPSSWGEFPLSYEFAPGEPGDGVTVDVPLAGLNQVSGEEFGWQVPGLREELVTELIRSLPKDLRRQLVPAPDVARAVLARLGPPGLPDGAAGADGSARGAGGRAQGADGRGCPGARDLLSALSAELRRMRGVTVPREAWNPDRLPAHLRMNFRVVDDGRVLAMGKDLGALRRELRDQMQDTLSEAARGITRTGLRSWEIGSLPRVFDDGRVRAYPALADTGEAVDVKLFGTEEEARESMWLGTRRLLLLQVPSGARAAAGRLPGRAKLALSRNPYPDITALLGDCAACAADQVIEEAGGPAWDSGGFAALLEAARSALPGRTAAVVAAVAEALAEAQRAEAALGGAAARGGASRGPCAAALGDIRSQLGALIHPGFVTGTGARRLPDLARYLRAIVRRLEKLPEDPGRDAERMAAIRRVLGAYLDAGGTLPPARGTSQDLQAVRWMIEELRVSLFAQVLGTPVPVSEKRIMAALDRLAERGHVPAR